MKKIWPPQDQVFWYINREPAATCHKDMEADVAIVGGGIAGLACAQAFAGLKKKVVLLEQYYCGSGASGKSSGFITPDAELSPTDFSKMYNKQAAKKIWDFISSGVDDIRTNITTHKFSCDYLPQNTLVVANSKSAIKELREDHETAQELGYASTLHSVHGLHEILGSKKYFGGLEYPDTFGINGQLYCQALKKVLQNDGVKVFEETPVTAIHGHTLETLHAKIKAEFIVICADHALPSLGFLKKQIYQIQTFLLISQHLKKEELHTIFPKKNLMVWDTDLIYNYFRVADNDRLLLGGGSIRTTYASKEYHNYGPIIKKLTNYFHEKFPTLTIQFEQVWPGIIGVSKDIAPIAGRDKDKKHIYYIAASAGLPIAAALGRYSAEHLINGRTDLDEYFSPYRSFPISNTLQTILGKKISFALSNLFTKYWW